MADIPLSDEAIDDAILAALAPAAMELESRLEDGVEGEPMMLWAVVVFGYLDHEGNQMEAYRRVGEHAGWFKVGGASKMLEAAYHKAWDQFNDEDGP